METLVEAFVRETAEEAEHAVGVVAARRPEAHGRAVAENDVGELGHGEAGIHLRKCRLP
jgi:hypothetical protein